jgi:hypothetical protein
MKKSSVFEWHNQFRVCCENIEDDKDNACHFYEGYCSV